MEREMLPTNIFQLITPCDTCVTACTEADMWFHMSQFQEYSNIPLQHTSDLAGLEFMKRIPFHLTSFKCHMKHVPKTISWCCAFPKRKFLRDFRCHPSFCTGSLTSLTIPASEETSPSAGRRCLRTTTSLSWRHTLILYIWPAHDRNSAIDI